MFREDDEVLLRPLSTIKEMRKREKKSNETVRYIVQFIRYDHP